MSLSREVSWLKQFFEDYGGGSIAFPDCYNKVLLQSWCLKITVIYSLTVLEAGSVKSRCQQGHDPSDGWRKSVPCPSFSFCSLPAILGITPASASASTWYSLSLSVCLYPTFPLLIRISSILDIGFTLIQDDLILT